MEDFKLGIDVSRHNGAIDWGVAKSQGVTFGAVRCVVGDYYFDPQFERNWENMGKSGVSRLVYNVPVFEKRSGKIVSAEQQLDWFYKKFGNRKPDFPVVGDLETASVRGASIYDVNNIAWKYMMGLKGFRNYGLPILYTNAYFGNRYLSNARWSQFDLWVASYVSPPFPVNWHFQPLLPTAWKKYKIHQFSADGNLQGSKYGANGSKSIDLDKMQPEYYRRYTNSTGTDEPEPEDKPNPEPEKKPQFITISVDGTRVMLFKGYDIEVVDD